ncbi:DNA polymerase Y family protein [Actinomycetaceae bacterium WB03_NA08]|uniref:DNA polymerase Y family protein n=1 Tax=Scrofimicrobium canadense TaxID=2652290 RepID=A0A6N7W793_9ACTO|nr:DNA polymerase Y family protein [Scrofimicrobium canadense]MSS84018.1 DNA polymerase Y family protein [Scrofimicrobium canadense]
MLGERKLVLWVPDWPLAAVQVQVPPGSPAVTVSRGRVLHTTRMARQWGIRRGMKQETALHMCNELIVLPDNPANDAAAFETVLELMDQHIPAVQALRSGLACAPLPSRERRGGSEDQLSLALIEDAAQELDIEAFVGVGSGIATAMCAAKRGLNIPVADTESFLSSLFLDELVTFFPENLFREALEILEALGIRKVQDLWSLGHKHVLSRLGNIGEALWALSRGGDIHVEPHESKPLNIRMSHTFDEPVSEMGHMYFDMQSLATRFMDVLNMRGVHLSEMEVSLSFADGTIRERRWLFFGQIDSQQIRTRIVWQLQSWERSCTSDRGSALTGVTIAAINAAPATTTGTLWGSLPRRGQVDHVLSQVQNTLGVEAVIQPVLQGGMNPRERTVLQAWGKNPSRAYEGTGEWAGQVEKAPAVLFDIRLAAKIIGKNPDGTWGLIRVTEHGMLVGAPERILVMEESPHVKKGPYRVRGVEQVWAQKSFWWRQEKRTEIYVRAAVEDHDDFLLVHSSGQWYLEGIYVQVPG